MRTGMLVTGLVFALSVATLGACESQEGPESVVPDQPAFPGGVHDDDDHSGSNPGTPAATPQSPEDPEDAQTPDTPQTPEDPADEDGEGPDRPVPGDGPATPVTGAAVGSACVVSDDCQGADAVCLPDTLSDGSAGWPEGYCTVLECDQVGCPSGATCYNTPDDAVTLCLADCTSVAGCRAGYACRDGACQPGCQGGDCPDGQVCDVAEAVCVDEGTGPGDTACSPGSCDSGYTCDTATGVCVPESTPGDGTIGAACDQDEDCLGGACLPDTYSSGEAGWPNGYCTALGCDQTPCPAGSVCAGTPDGELTLCLAECAVHADCRMDYACQSGTCQPQCAAGECPEGMVCDVHGACVPDDGDAGCTDSSCAPGFLCDAETGECVPDVSTVASDGAVGAACAEDTDCEGAAEAFCIPAEYDDGSEGWPAGYCSIYACDQVGCPADAACYVAGDDFYLCLDVCTASSDCRGGYACINEACQPGCQPGDCTEGYVCGEDGVCVEDATGADTGSGKVGAACTTADDCEGGDNAACIPAVYNDGSDGWPEGYCVQVGCDETPCPAGSTCFTTPDQSQYICFDDCFSASDCRAGYVCDGDSSCVPGCEPGTCPDGMSCGADGLCSVDPEPPCTPGSCGVGMVCDASGVCVPDLAGGPGVGPGPSCDLPPRDCTGGEAYCGALIPFEPVEGPGYENYPLNGETWTNQYRSYARRDLMMLIKYATAYVACKAQSWGGGNNAPLGLGDMSEADGAIPGTSDGSPGHPPGTHVDGFDMDIAYYQTGNANNHLRSICPHTIGGVDQYHCVAAPDTLDVWRSALFLGALMSSDRVRVIGVDGQVGTLVTDALDVLCAQNWLPSSVCSASSYPLAYEVTNNNLGWYLFHHHHLHVSLWGVGPGMVGPSSGLDQCLNPICDNSSSDDSPGAAGHSHVEDVPTRHELDGIGLL